MALANKKLNQYQDAIDIVPNWLYRIANKGFGTVSRLLRPDDLSGQDVP